MISGSRTEEGEAISPILILLSIAVITVVVLVGYYVIAERQYAPAEPLNSMLDHLSVETHKSDAKAKAFIF